jgi:hypothetical protein
VRRAAAAAALTLALAGCGGGDGDGSPAAQASATPAVAPKLPYATCARWKALGQERRKAFVTQLTLFFGAPVNAKYGRGQTLDADTAFALLDRSCAPAYAGHIKLYKIYGRAAAFTP